jgi:hypothetical protein
MGTNMLYIIETEECLASDVYNSFSNPITGNHEKVTPGYIEIG